MMADLLVCLYSIFLLNPHSLLFTGNPKICSASNILNHLISIAFWDEKLDFHHLWRRKLKTLQMLEVWSKKKQTLRETLSRRGSINGKRNSLHQVEYPSLGKKALTSDFNRYPFILKQCHLIPVSQNRGNIRAASIPSSSLRYIHFQSNCLSVFSTPETACQSTQMFPFHDSRFIHEYIL